MKPQQYSNHVRYYPAHHFIFYPLVTLGFILSIRGIIIHPEQFWEWVLISGLWAMITWLSFMLRQHYAMICQNRIVRMEMRFRYYVLTQQRLEPLEQQLSFNHIAALRFASDEELPGLVQRAVKENHSPNDIKKSIRNWVPDDMRV
ncbi:MAG: DUF6526 family protein [Chitinophagaceae bacterium]